MARVDAQIQRKNFERQLASAEQRLQAALAAAKMAVLEWEPVSDAVTFCDTVTDVFGLVPGQTLSSRSFIFGLVYPDDSDQYSRRCRLRPAGMKVSKAISGSSGLSTVVGEYTSGLPSVVGTCRISDYGAA